MPRPISSTLASRFSILVCALLLAACTGEIGAGSYLDHEVDEDFLSHSTTIPGIPNSFTRNDIVSDDVFTNQDLTGDMVQGFLENTPYFGGTRSWLADVQVNGMRASDALVAAARERNINPLMLLARLQVEKGAVSRSQRPSQHNIDYTMGCGCHDGQSCSTAFRGFDKQMECAADTLRTHFDRSREGVGAWRVGSTRQSLDPLSVRPANHATASLYAYTPWVLQGAGGNWLVWNVTKKYATALRSVLPSSGNSGDSGDSGSSDTDAGTSCSFSGASGMCIDTNTTGCDGTVVTGVCPGAANIRCCLPQ